MESCIAAIASGSVLMSPTMLAHPLLIIDFFRDKNCISSPHVLPLMSRQQIKNLGVNHDLEAEEPIVVAAMF